MLTRKEERINEKEACVACNEVGERYGVACVAWHVWAVALQGRHAVYRYMPRRSDMACIAACGACRATHATHATPSAHI